MLNSQHISTLNDITNNFKSDVLALTKHGSAQPLRLLNLTLHHPATPFFPLSRSSSSHPFKPISAGGTAFLLNEPVLIRNSSSHSYSSFWLFFRHSQTKKHLFTSFNIYRPPPPSPYSQSFSAFFNFKPICLFPFQCRYHPTSILHHRGLQHTCW